MGRGEISLAGGERVVDDVPLLSGSSDWEKVIK